MMALKGEKAYGLFHVRVATGERVRWSTMEVLSKQEAESRALECRIGKARGSYCSDGWSIEAHPLEG